MSEPTIHLKHAELLHVTLATAAHMIGSQTNYPVANLEGVLGAYRKCRDKHLAGLGYTQKQINAYTEAAAEAIVGWLEDRESNLAAADADFTQWAKEILDDTDHP